MCKYLRSHQTLLHSVMMYRVHQISIPRLCERSHMARGGSLNLEYKIYRTLYIKERALKHPRGLVKPCSFHQTSTMTSLLLSLHLRGERPPLSQSLYKLIYPQQTNERRIPHYHENRPVEAEEVSVLWGILCATCVTQKAREEKHQVLVWQKSED